MAISISRRQFGFLAGAAVAASSLAACSGGGTGSGKGKVVWSTWGSPEDLKSFDKFQEAFKKSNPDIDLVFQPTPSYSEYHSKLLTQLSSGTAPDVFYIGDDRVASVIRNNVLMPIGDKLSGTSISEDDFAANVLDIGRWEGKLYALPNDVNPDTLWYDKEALKAAGITDDPAQLAADDKWTTEVFFDMTAKLKAADLTGAVYWNYWATHDGFMTAQGGKVYDDQGKYVAHKDQASITAMEEYAKRFQSGEMKLADLLPEGAGSDTLLVTHKLGFLAAGRYTIGSIRGAGVDETLYDIVRWPSVDGKAKPTGVAASYLAINAKTADTDAALKFFSSFLDADGQKLRLEGAGNAVPSIKGADEIVLSENYPAHAQTMLDMRDMGYSNFATEAAVPDLSNQISVELMQPLYEGKSDAKTTLEAVAKLVEEKTA
ncbi:MAG: extracellular solute-binding protein [Arachnia sp.]